MAVNEELEVAVLKVMGAKVMELDPGFKGLCGFEVEMAGSMLRAMGTVQIDRQAKYRLMAGGRLGYGYDFTKDFDGVPAKEVYERAVEATRKKMLGPMGEDLIHDEVVDERFGVYLTQLPL